MKTILSLLIVTFCVPAMAAEVLTIAAASDLAPSMDELSAAFRREAPQAQVKVSTGASGTLFAQIRNGAPFDVFMSANIDYPLRLVHEGDAVGGTLTHYAVGRLALWTMDARFDPSRGLAMLVDARIKRIAIANPDVAPYGQAARAELKAGGMWDKVQPRLVLGENVAQAVQFVQSGNAQAGIVPISALLSAGLKERGRYAMLVRGIDQGAVVTLHGKTNPLASQWVRFLHSAAARAVFAAHGLTPAPAP